MDRAQILRLIPHAGAMCLLDAVMQWDAVAVRCQSRRCKNRDNPLRRADGALGAACGIEIAAQAMALHGRLIAPDGAPPSGGYLASLRDVRLEKSRLDTVDGDLAIDVERLMGDATGASYRFVITAEGVTLLGGRATVLLRIGE